VSYDNFRGRFLPHKYNIRVIYGCRGPAKVTRAEARSAQPVEARIRVGAASKMQRDCLARANRLAVATFRLWKTYKKQATTGRFAASYG